MKRSKANISFINLICVAVLVELVSAVQYYSSQRIIRHNMERYVSSEIERDALYMINEFTAVDTAVNNMEWVVQRNLSLPDSMFVLSRRLVEYNPGIQGACVVFVPNYYPQKGYWFEPYAVRLDYGHIETKQLGSASHDYTKADFYTVPLKTGRPFWSEPYMDEVGAHAWITTYSVPVRDTHGNYVAVMDADLSLDWVDKVVKENSVYPSARQYLLSREGNLLAGEADETLLMAQKAIAEDEDRDGYSIIKGHRGKKMHVFYQQVDSDAGWSIIYVCKDSDVFGRLLTDRLQLLTLALLGLILLTVIVYRASQHLEKLHEVNEEKNRIEGELSVAREIQRNMLPPQQFHREDLDIYGTQLPAREVGGDLFDYFVRDEKLFFCIGDVSGKGAAAAMLMAATRALFRSASAHENNPARIMAVINEASCQGNEKNMFVTLLVGVLDLPTGSLRYCNAGHDHPFVLEGGKVSLMPAQSNLPVGVFPDVVYRDEEARLSSGSTLFLYTDGLTEAKNGERRQFGMERVEANLVACSAAGKNPQQILQAMLGGVKKFVAGADPSDDLTLLAIHYSHKPFESSFDASLSLVNRVDEVERLSAFLKEVAASQGWEPSLASKLRLAVEEAVVNVIDYAYPAGTEGKIALEVCANSSEIHFRILDTGVPFDPTVREKADTSLSAEDRQIGGLGIFLVREMMDVVNYERQDGKNILTLIKHIQ